jgi:hypothetical protein
MCFASFCQAFKPRALKKYFWLKVFLKSRSENGGFGLKSWMIFIMIGVSAASGLAVLSKAEQPTQDPQTEQAIVEARQISSELADKVRGLLFKEIGKGGWASAVKVCSEMAQNMTREFNARTGHTVRRVSLRYRHPRNTPDQYERRKLEEFDLLNKRKEMENEYSEVLDEGGQKYLRYMRPIVVLPLCINCHGPKENIPSDVKSILAEKYPEDRATGFLVGDLRGAISVKIFLSPSK